MSNKSVTLRTFSVLMLRKRSETDFVGFSERTPYGKAHWPMHFVDSIFSLPLTTSSTIFDQNQIFASNEAEYDG